MASKKTTPGPKTEDLTRSLLPGGGVAEWFKQEELTPRRERPLTVLNATLAPKYKQAFAASGKSEDEIEDWDLIFSREDNSLLLEVQETAAVTYLKSWSRSEPVPQTADELLDLPTPIYNALIAHAAKIMGSQIADQFSVDNVENLDSPTGDSAA